MDIARIKLLITIVDKDTEDKILKIYNKYHLPFEIVLNGLGTASSSVLDYFGLDEIRKILILNVIPEDLESNVLYELHNKYGMHKPGKGIAFTIPISSSSKFLSTETSKITVSKETKKMQKTKKYDLILTIVSEGYSDSVMTLAKKAGAGGGTIIHGRALGNEDVVKFFNISIVPEKELILILSEKNKKHDIMNTITENFGLKTEARAICFSLPIDEVVGLDQSIIFEK